MRPFCREKHLLLKRSPPNSGRLLACFFVSLLKPLHHSQDGQTGPQGTRDAGRMRERVLPLVLARPRLNDKWAITWTLWTEWNWQTESPKAILITRMGAHYLRCLITETGRQLRLMCISAPSLNTGAMIKMHFFLNGKQFSVLKEPGMTSF